jgi:hypothetical protein
MLTLLARTEPVTPNAAARGRIVFVLGRIAKIISSRGTKPVLGQWAEPVVVGLVPALLGYAEAANVV